MAGIIVDAHELEELQLGLQGIPEAIPQVTSYAINRAVDVMRTESWKAVSAEYNIHQKDLYDHLTLIKSSPSDIRGGIASAGPHLPISTFPMTPSNPQPAKHPFVTFNIKKGRV